MPSATDLLALYAPTLAADPHALLWVADARSVLRPCAWGKFYEQAVALLAAHNMSRANAAAAGGADAAGAVTSKREGELAITYGTAGSGSDAGTDWSTSPFGLRLLALQKMAIGAVGVTGGLDRGCAGGVVWPPCP